MGLLNKKLFVVQVDFFGVTEWAVSDTSPDLSAAVYAPLNVDVGGRPALALLIPLTAAKLLYNSKAQRELTTPMMGALRTAASSIAEGPEEAQAFEFRQGDFDGVALRAAIASGGDETLLDEIQLDHFEDLLLAAVPRLKDAPAGSPDQAFIATLMQGRGGWWTKVKAPWRGPAFFAAFGLFALIEHAARNEDFEQCVLPAMAGLGALGHLYFNVLRGHGFDSMRTLTLFNQTISDVVLSQDPVSALTDVEESFEWGVDIVPTPQVAAYEHAEAEDRHEFNAVLADTPLDDPVAEETRIEAKRLLIEDCVPDLADAVVAWQEALVNDDDSLANDDAEGDDDLTRAEAAENGYAVRMAEEQLDRAPRLSPLAIAAVRQRSDRLSQVLGLMEATPSLSALEGASKEGLDELRFWSRQVASHFSRERFRQATGGYSVMGVYAASSIDYEQAFNFGYLLRAVDDSNRQESAPTS